MRFICYSCSRACSRGDHNGSWSLVHDCNVVGRDVSGTIEVGDFRCESSKARPHDVEVTPTARRVFFL